MNGEVEYFRKRFFGGFNRKDVVAYIARLANERNEQQSAKEKAERELQSLIDSTEEQRNKYNELKVDLEAKTLECDQLKIEYEEKLAECAGLKAALKNAKRQYEAVIQAEQSGDDDAESGAVDDDVEKAEKEGKSEALRVKKKKKKKKFGIF